MSVYFRKHLYSGIMQCTFCTYRNQISMLEKSAIHQEEKGSHAGRYIELSSLELLYRSLEYRVSYFHHSTNLPHANIFLKWYISLHRKHEEWFPIITGTWLFFSEAYLCEFLPCIINLEQVKNVIFNLS